MVAPLLSILLTAYGRAHPVSPTREHRIHTVHASSTSNHPSDQSSPPNPAIPLKKTLTAHISASPPGQQEQGSTDPTPRGIQWASELSNLFIAFFAGGTFMFIGMQIKTARDTERGWVLAETIGNPDENWPNMTNTGYYPGILVRFKIYGKTPVKIVEARFVIDLVPSKAGTAPLQPNLPYAPNYRAIPKDECFTGSGVLVPIGATVDIRRDLVNTSSIKEKLPQLRDGTILLCAYGYIKYRDIFDRRRETRGCYVYDFAWGGILTDLDGNVLNPAGFRQAGPPKYNSAT